MANKYVIGKDEPAEQPVHVWLEPLGDSVALHVRCGTVSQRVAVLQKDGTLTRIPMASNAASNLGLRITSAREIVVV